VVRAEDRDYVVDTIMKAARTGKKGAFGDGKIFVSPVEDIFTISSGARDTAAPQEAAA
jgi:nitrogen regulatory protein PII 1